MKRKSLILGIVLGGMLLAGSALAGKSSMDYGKQLFNDQALSGSTNEQSCNSCHADGKGLENAGKNKNLSQAINKCLTGAMHGEKMDGRSAEMRSMKIYVTSLAAE